MNLNFLDRLLDVSQSRCFTRLASNLEKRTLAALTEEQRRQYLAGKLRHLEMTPDEVAAYLARGASAQATQPEAVS